MRYVSKSASATTRTYRVEVAIDNADGAIPDGITCEVAIPMAPVMAARVPRSALTLSSSGDVGVRAEEPGDGEVHEVVVGHGRVSHARPGSCGPTRRVVRDW